MKITDDVLAIRQTAESVRKGLELVVYWSKNVFPSMSRISTLF